MMMTFRTSAILPSLALLATCAFADKPTVGKAAPAFKMTTLEGKALSNASLKGKVVLIDFWATWCGPCKMAAPTLQSLHQKYGGKGLVVVGANTFERGDKNGAKAKQYRAEHKYTYTFTSGNDALATAWGVEGIPTFVLIDKSGVVRLVNSGYDPSMGESFGKTIEKLLAAK